MSASKTIKKLVGLLGAILTLSPAAAMADFELNLHQGVTKISHEIYDIHMLVLWIVTIVGILVFGVMIYSIINHRKSKGVKPATFHESTVVEVIWTIIPFVILVAIAVPATKTLLEMDDMSHPDVNIKVVGWQWKWEYDYLDNGVRFFSNLAESSVKASQLHSGADVTKVDHYLLDVDHPLVVPVGKKVRLLITGNDVIHSWWVPQLGVKHDAIPGYINESWFRADKEGVYRGQCAELCGKGHGFMPIVVKVVSENDYNTWVEEQKKAAAAAAQDVNKVYTKEELMKHGEAIYNKDCAACHQPNGMGLPGVFPALAGSKTVDGPIEGHLHTVIFGRPGTAMQAFGKQLSAYDIAAVVTFERNSFGNHMGDMAQPSDVITVEKSSK
ncbi:MAG: cytochrome c oxidase subunit II [Gammaproteobacteria bacterium]|nr:cytochrome c oxidase subunit II [Gammaproteobacteria bacterium]